MFARADVCRLRTRVISDAISLLDDETAPRCPNPADNESPTGPAPTIATARKTDVGYPKLLISFKAFTPI
jgi:hypothetical protein